MTLTRTVGQFVDTRPPIVCRRNPFESFSAVSALGIVTGRDETYSACDTKQEIEFRIASRLPTSDLAIWQ
jgi:hypothetical protein